jgi:hypothetical protein
MTADGDDQERGIPLEIIRIVEQAHLSTKHTLDRLRSRRIFYRWHDRYLTVEPELFKDRPSAPRPGRNRIGTVHRRAGFPHSHHCAIK